MKINVRYDLYWNDWIVSRGEESARFYSWRAAIEFAVIWAASIHNLGYAN